MGYRFNVYLKQSLILASKEGKVADVLVNPQAPLKDVDSQELMRLDNVHNGIEDFYTNFANGYTLEWWANKDEGTSGKLRFVSTESLFSDSNLYDERDDEDLQYFHPLDYPTPESYVGFIINPDVIHKSLFYMSVSDYELYNLDLDYEGYTQMALEARVFNHWQKVLLYYMGDIETGQSETETFKTEMPKIFADWTWENFIARFESLRLSNKG